MRYIRSKEMKPIKECSNFISLEFVLGNKQVQTCYVCQFVYSFVTCGVWFEEVLNNLYTKLSKYVFPHPSLPTKNHYAIDISIYTLG